MDRKLIKIIKEFYKQQMDESVILLSSLHCKRMGERFERCNSNFEFANNILVDKGIADIFY